MSMIGNFLRISESEFEKMQNNSSYLEEIIYDENIGDNLIDIDKSWDGISFLFTGKNFMEAFPDPKLRFFLSGQILDENQDLGYGPAHFLLANEVSEINEFLQNLDATKLKENYDPEKMISLEVYPEIWGDEDELEYLTSNFEGIREFYKIAAENGECVITYLN